MFFFFNDTATTEIYTLSLHDALPIFAVGGHAGPFDDRAQPATDRCGDAPRGVCLGADRFGQGRPAAGAEDRKSTRLNSSHSQISYAVFCLKKKKKNKQKMYNSIHKEK